MSSSLTEPPLKRKEKRKTKKEVKAEASAASNTITYYNIHHCWEK
jgi:hypothetical protein